MAPGVRWKSASLPRLACRSLPCGGGKWAFRLIPAGPIPSSSTPACRVLRWARPPGRKGLLDLLDLLDQPAQCPDLSDHKAPPERARVAHCGGRVMDRQEVLLGHCPATSTSTPRMVTCMRSANADCGGQQFAYALCLLKCHRPAAHHAGLAANRDARGAKSSDIPDAPAGWVVGRKAQIDRQFAQQNPFVCGAF